MRVGADADVAGVLAGAEAMIRLGLTRGLLFETTVGRCKSNPALKAPSLRSPHHRMPPHSTQHKRVETMVKYVVIGCRYTL